MGDVSQRYGRRLRCSSLFLRIHIFVISFLVIGSSLFADTPEIKIQKVDSSPKIDGYIEESFWGKVASYGDFVQYDPYNGESASEKTVVRLAYNRDNLYIAVNCLDSEPEKIKGDLTPREQFDLYGGNDYICVFLDTYFDKRNAYYLALNPRGVQWDKPGEYLWKSGAVIHAEGWSVEYQIPFKSIRFPTGTPKPWGINFERYVFRLKETSHLSHVGRDDVELEKSAALVGLEGIQGGKSVELFPYAGYRNSVSGEEKDNKLAAGIDARYSVTSNLNLDVTVSPDFSEVESDPFFYQLIPYEFFLREKRPFFQEAWRYFEDEELFYTRRVSNPKFAFKLTGKERGFTIGMLGALNKAADTDEYIGALCVKKDIFSLSSVTFTYSGYRTPDFTNHNAGIDLNLKFSRATELGIISYLTHNSDMEKQRTGHYRMYFQHWPDEGFRFTGEYRRMEKNYNPRAGFRWGGTDITRIILTSAYGKRINRFGIKQINYQMLYRLMLDDFGNYLGYDFRPFWFWGESLKNHFFYLFGNFGNRRVQVSSEEELYWTEDFFQNNGIIGGMNYRGNRFFTAFVNAEVWREPVYDEDFTQAFDGRAVYLWSEWELKPTSFINITLGLEYRKQNIRATGEELFEGLISSANVHYQVAPQVFLSSYIQHDSQYKRVNLDVLLGIELGMGNMFSVSYKGFYPYQDSPYEHSARSFVVKASYLIRL